MKNTVMNNYLRGIFFVAAALLQGSCSFKAPNVPSGLVRCGGTRGTCPKDLICTNVQTTTGPMDLCCITEGCANETVKLPPGVGGTEPRTDSGARGTGGTSGAIRDAGPLGRGGAGGMPDGTGGAGGVLMNGDAGPNPPLLAADGGRNTGTAGDAPLVIVMNRLDGRPPVDAPPGCSGACIVGTKRCGVTAGVQVCVDVQGCGAWAAETKCPGVQICRGTEPSAACACPAAPGGCGAGQGSFCESTTALATCVADAQGCVTISGRITCGAGKPCTGTHPTANCSCPTAPAACAAGTGTSCQSNMLVTCANDTSGCVAVSSMTACPTGKPCVGNAPNAACTCPAAPAGCNGQTSGTYCALSAVATCAADANGCVAATTMACANGCVGAHPSAACCVPACSGKCGGSDGCGGSCPNNCAGVQTCGGGGTANVCGCALACTGKCGGPDGCNGTCPNNCKGVQTCGGAGTANVCGEPCGTPMPNPASAGLPNAASYDTATTGVVIDKRAGLMWEHPVTSTTYNQANAAAYCTALRTGGFSNWRLPTRIELVSIVDFTVSNPSINATAFPSTPSTYFWTSSVVSGSPGNAWSVGFYSGDTDINLVANTSAVRCVR